MASHVGWANELNRELVAKYHGDFVDHIEGAFDTGKAAGMSVLGRREVDKLTPRWDVLVATNGWAAKYSGALRRWHVYTIGQ